MALVPLLLLALQIPAVVPAPDPLSAAEQAVRALERGGRFDPELPAALQFGDGLNRVDQERVRTALAARIPGLKLHGDGAVQELQVTAARTAGGEEMRAASNGGEAARVPFLRKDWVRTLTSGAERVQPVRRSSGSALAVQGELASDDSAARTLAAEQAVRTLGQGLRGDAMGRYRVLAGLARFRTRMDAATRRALTPAGLLQHAQLDEYLERREFSVGPMTRACLLIDQDSNYVRSARQQLAFEARAAAREVVARGGGVVVGWALLLALSGLLNRWTRGYLTGRLRLLALALGGGLFWLLWVA